MSLVDAPYQQAYDQALQLASAFDGLADLAHAPGLQEVRRHLWCIEQNRLVGGDFPFPNYHWDMVDYTNGYALRDQMDKLAGQAVTLSFREALNTAALAWRFGGLRNPHANRLTECSIESSRRHLDACPTEDLFDYLLILSFLGFYEGAARIAKFVAARPDLPEQLRCYTADMLYLTTFQRHRLSGDDTTPTKHIPNPEKALEIASRIAGPKTLNAAIYKSLDFTLKGDLPQSETALQDALEIQGSLFARLMTARQVSSKEMLDTAVQNAKQDRPAPYPDGANFSMQLRHKGADENCLFVASEKRYFDRFGETLLASIGASNPNQIVHFHMVDFMITDGELDALENKHNVRINISTDQFVKSPLFEAYGDYIVNARYVYLPAILAQYGAVFLTDIDGLIYRDLKKYNLIKSPSVLFSTRMNLKTATTKNPVWGCVSGGIFGISNEPDCMVFAKAMAHLMSRKLKMVRKNGGKLFYADQCGLAQLYLALRGTVPFRNMQGAFFQQAHDIEGTDRLENKEEWQTAKLAAVQKGEIITGAW